MANSALCKPWEHSLSRRQWLGGAIGTAGALGMGGLLGRGVAEEVQRKQRQVLFIWIDGGISQLESWDPKPNTAFGGPFRAWQQARPKSRRRGLQR